MAGKRNKYKPLKNVLSIDTALVQASSLLDMAAQQAIDDGDIRGMRKTAHSWLEMSAVMHQLSQAAEPDEEEETEVLSETQIGFRANPQVDGDEEEEYDEEEPEFKIGFRSNK